MNATAAKDAIELGRDWAEADRWNGIDRDYAPEDVIRLRGSLRIEHTLARHGAEKLWRLLAEEDYVAALGALTGGQAVQMAKAGSEGDLPLRLAGRRGRQPRRGRLSRPEPVSGEQRPGDGEAAEQRAPARRPDRVGRGHGRSRRLPAPDRRRRRGRLRRPAERIRADEGDDRVGRRGRPLRGPALVREEVRPPRREGARSDRAVHPHPAGGAARGRRARRADPRSSRAPTPTRRS